MRLLRLLLAAVFVCCALAPARGRDTIVAPGFTVKRGRQVEYRELRVTFLAVEEDSRCPEDVACIQAGNARVRLRARNSKGARVTFVLNTNASPREYKFGRYVIALKDLRPLPSASGEQRARAYEASLTIFEVNK